MKDHRLDPLVDELLGFRPARYVDFNMKAVDASAAVLTNVIAGILSRHKRGCGCSAAIFDGQQQPCLETTICPKHQCPRQKH